MTLTVILCLASFAAGVAVESRADLSGRLLVLWRWFNARRKG